MPDKKPQTVAEAMGVRSNWLATMRWIWHTKNGLDIYKVMTLSPKGRAQVMRGFDIWLKRIGKKRVAAAREYEARTGKNFW